VHSQRHNIDDLQPCPAIPSNTVLPLHPNLDRGHKAAYIENNNHIEQKLVYEHI
jgi:hypothetical protein